MLFTKLGRARKYVFYVVCIDMKWKHSAIPLINIYFGGEFVGQIVQLHESFGLWHVKIRSRVHNRQPPNKLKFERKHKCTKATENSRRAKFFSFLLVTQRREITRATSHNRLPCWKLIDMEMNACRNVCIITSQPPFKQEIWQRSFLSAIFELIANNYGSQTSDLLNFRWVYTKFLRTIIECCNPDIICIEKGWVRYILKRVYIQYSMPLNN